MQTLGTVTAPNELRVPYYFIEISKGDETIKPVCCQHHSCCDDGVAVLCLMTAAVDWVQAMMNCSAVSMTPLSLIHQQQQLRRLWIESRLPQSVACDGLAACVRACGRNRFYSTAYPPQQQQQQTIQEVDPIFHVPRHKAGYRLWRQDTNSLAVLAYWMVHAFKAQREQLSISSAHCHYCHYFGRSSRLCQCISLDICSIKRKQMKEKETAE